MRTVHGTLVSGVGVGPETRCTHYDGERDVVAFKFACCERYYPCFRCHEAVATHDAVPWNRERFDAPSVLCGVCGVELTAPEYRRSDHACPECGAAFNPGCANHAHRYFEW